MTFAASFAASMALEEEARAGINHKKSMLVELGRLARVPEAAVAPRAWRGGLIAAQGTPGKGVFGDQISRWRESFPTTARAASRYFPSSALIARETESKCSDCRELGCIKRALSAVSTNS